MPGHIEKIGNMHYKIIVEAGRDPSTGKRKRIKKTFHGKKSDAEDEMAKIEYELKNGIYIDDSKFTFGEYLIYWLANYAKNKVTIKTYYRYDQLVHDRIIPKLGQINLTDLKPLHLQAFYNELLEEGTISPQTVLHYHRLIHNALNRAIKWQLIPRNVSDAIEPPSVPKQIPQILDFEQVKTMLGQALGTPYYITLVLAVTTGMRRGEILGLKWDDVDLNQGFITVRQELQYVPGKGRFFKEGTKTDNSTRKIDISSFIISILKKHRVSQLENKLKHGEKYHDKNNLVICQQNGESVHPDSITSWFPGFIQSIGLPKDEVSRPAPYPGLIMA